MKEIILIILLFLGIILIFVGVKKPKNKLPMFKDNSFDDAVEKVELDENLLNSLSNEQSKIPNGIIDEYPSIDFDNDEIPNIEELSSIEIENTNEIPVENTVEKLENLTSDDFVDLKVENKEFIEPSNFDEFENSDDYIGFDDNKQMLEIMKDINYNEFDDESNIEKTDDISEIKENEVKNVIAQLKNLKNE